MELILMRTYHPQGTNGALYSPNGLICNTIELPWCDNKRNVSCIPEGRYELAPRETITHGKHLLVKNVPDRSYILLHSANNALLQLRGCIAPVSRFEGAGKGSESREALAKLVTLTYAAFTSKEPVWLMICRQNIQHMPVAVAEAAVITSLHFTQIWEQYPAA